MLENLQDDVTVITGVAIVVGLLGTVVPILPGGALVAGAIGVWALVVQSAAGWLAFAAAVVLVLLGAALKYVTAGRLLTASTVPTRSLVIAGLLGVVGFFVIPVLGLVIGLVGGLYAAEYYRMRDTGVAWSSSVVAMKGVGLGVLVELGAALLAATVWLVAVLRGAAA